MHEALSLVPRTDKQGLVAHTEISVLGMNQMFKVNLSYIIE